MRIIYSHNRGNLHTTSTINKPQTLNLVQRICTTENIYTALAGSMIAAFTLAYYNII